MYRIEEIEASLVIKILPNIVIDYNFDYVIAPLKCSGCGQTIDYGPGLRTIDLCVRLVLRD